MKGIQLRLLLHRPLVNSSKQLHSCRTNSSSSKPHKPSNSSTSPFRNQPGPPPLPAAEQREFEELVRRAQAPLSTSPKAHTTGVNSSSGGSEAAVEVLERHPDARKPVPPEFIGEVNPKTGEVGGPKREPVKFGDWSYGGKVTDF